MNREYYRWYSPLLDRDMELLIFGHGGAKMQVLPTGDGCLVELVRAIDGLFAKAEKTSERPRIRFIQAEAARQAFAL